MQDIISIQLYSLRDYGNLARQLETLASIGFSHVETIGSHLANAAETRSLLDQHGMTAPSGHVGLADLRERFDWVADQAAAIGISQLYMPAVPPSEREGMPAGYWRKLGVELGEMAVRMKSHNIGLGYHNHHWELFPCADGAIPFDLLIEASAGSPLTIEADLAWLVRGGADPLAWMAKHKDRLSAIHVKDIAPQGENLDEDGWANVGAGTLDWPALHEAARSHGVRLMVLEHDKPADAAAFARQSYAYLTGLSGEAAKTSRSA